LIIILIGAYLSSTQFDLNPEKNDELLSIENKSSDNKNNA